jgi:hypothetical protein
MLQKAGESRNRPPNEVLGAIFPNVHLPGSQSVVIRWRVLGSRALAEVAPSCAQWQANVESIAADTIADRDGTLASALRDRGVAIDWDECAVALVNPAFGVRNAWSALSSSTNLRRSNKFFLEIIVPFVVAAVVLVLVLCCLKHCTRQPPIVDSGVSVPHPHTLVTFLTLIALDFKILISRIESNDGAIAAVSVARICISHVSTRLAPGTLLCGASLGHQLHSQACYAMKTNRVVTIPSFGTASSVGG